MVKREVKPQTADEYFATRKPRRWWINIYANGTPGMCHATRDLAKSTPLFEEEVLETICVEEVLDAPSD